MSRWWQNERTLLAAAVRSTRRRLRAGFRGSLNAQKVKLYEATRQAIIAAEESCERRARDAERKADDAVKLVAKATMMARNERYARQFVVTVNVSDEVFRATPDSRSLMREIGESMARAVRHEFANAPATGSLPAEAARD